MLWLIPIITLLHASLSLSLITKFSTPSHRFVNSVSRLRASSAGFMTHYEDLTISTLAGVSLVDITKSMK